MFSLRVDDEVELELAEMHHAQELFDLTDRNREHLAPWMPWAATTTSVADTTAFLTFIRGEYAAGRAFHANVRYRGAIVGGMGLHDMRPTDGTVELGYWLDEGHVGKGITTRATRALVTAVFAQGYVRVAIKAAVDNVRSRAVAERLGFTFEGVERMAAKVGDKHHDHAVYSMLAAEWSAGTLAG
ncbi:MAG TPA: GNAT family protein [Frankiaceae bacterium]|jgi:ribosomal-protein-serine acetyltransferase|nr:GNAT family protein [Frankiaceae bacterium]